MDLESARVENTRDKIGLWLQILCLAVAAVVTSWCSRHVYTLPKRVTDKIVCCGLGLQTVICPLKV